MRYNDTPSASGEPTRSRKRVGEHNGTAAHEKGNRSKGADENGRRDRDDGDGEKERTNNDDTGRKRATIEVAANEDSDTNTGSDSKSGNATVVIDRASNGAGPNGI